MTIRKGFITYTFMFDDNINSVDDVNAMSLDDIMAECDTGHMLGLASWGDHNIVEVPNEKVAEEEIALGCDGTFFADPDALWDQQNGQDGNERPDRDCDPDCSRRASPAAECDCSRSK